jgi:hypothetical protein
MFTTSPLRRAGAECIGTYALVTAGCGAIVVNASTGALTHIGVAFTFGLIIMVMIAAHRQRCSIVRTGGAADRRADVRHCLGRD